MRRITSTALAVVAFCATAGSTIVPAHAADSTAYPVAGPSDSGRAAATTAADGSSLRVKKHYFHVSDLRGSYTSGDFYWRKYQGKNYYWFDFHLSDTKADGKAAALCYKLSLHKGAWCIVNTHGKGKQKVNENWGLFPNDHISVFGAVGILDSKKNTFNVSKRGPWHKLR
jgi:hypothetical protein